MSLHTDDDNTESENRSARPELAIDMEDEARSVINDMNTKLSPAFAA